MDMKVYVDHHSTTDAGILNQEVLHVGIEGKKQFWIDSIFCGTYSDIDYRYCLPSIK